MSEAIKQIVSEFEKPVIEILSLLVYPVQERVFYVLVLPGRS